jgi:hypothetical protein
VNDFSEVELSESAFAGAVACGAMVVAELMLEIAMKCVPRLTLS